MSETKKASNFKQRAIRELINYWTTFLYLVVFFGSFVTYRRLVLAQYHISYLHYGVAVIEALILAKVILIGDALHLGRGVEEKPLIYPTLYKALTFAAWVAFFKLIEDTIRGLLHGSSLAAGFDEIAQEGPYALLAKCVIIFTAFIPFFAFRELGRVLGEGKITELFFHRKTVTDTGSTGGAYPGIAK